MYFSGLCWNSKSRPALLTHLSPFVYLYGSPFSFSETRERRSISAICGTSLCQVASRNIPQKGEQGTTGDNRRTVATKSARNATLSLFVLC